MNYARLTLNLKEQILLESLHYLHWYLSKRREYPGFHQILKELYEEGSLTRQQRVKLTSKRLRKLLVHAGQYVPYYRTLFREIGFNPETANLPDDLSKIPVLTKSIIQEKSEELISTNVNKVDLIKNATGGSTGNPLAFYQDRNYQTVAIALETYVRSWWGIKPYDKTALIWGADQDFKDLSFKEKLYALRSRERGLNAFRMTDQSLAEFCSMLENWSPPYLVGYSTALDALASYVSKHKLKIQKFKAIRSSAEMLWPKQRENIENAFDGSPVYNFYGSREINNLAAECKNHQLHLVSSWRHVEVVNKDGVPEENGGSGEFAVTDLSNFSMPFIRYKNGDAGSISEQQCDCGHSTSVITQLLGRSSDLIRTESGGVVHGEYFTHLFYGNNDIKRFQVHQKTYDKMDIRYVSVTEIDENYKQELCDKIRKQLDSDVNINLIRCDEIDIPASGKHRFTISDLN